MTQLRTPQDHVELEKHRFPLFPVLGASPRNRRPFPTKIKCWETLVFGLPEF